MKIIDIHTHAGDTLFRRPLPYEPYEPYPDFPSWMLPFQQAEFDLARTDKLLPPEVMKLYDGILGLGERGLIFLEAIHCQESNNAATVDNLLKAMKRNNVDYSVVLPVEPYRMTMEEIKVCKKHKNLIVFASVHPRDPKKIERIRRYMKLGCRGLKLHPIVQGVHPSDPSVFELMEEYRRYNLPVLFHSGKRAYYLTQSMERRDYGALRNYEGVISNFPKVNFILAHMGGEMERDTALEMGERYKNIYVDTQMQPVEAVREAIIRLGSDRVLYGSDYPFGLQEAHISVVNKVAGKDMGLKEKLFYRNAESLIGKVA